MAWRLVCPDARKSADTINTTRPALSATFGQATRYAAAFFETPLAFCHSRESLSTGLTTPTRAIYSIGRLATVSLLTAPIKETKNTLAGLDAHKRGHPLQQTHNSVWRRHMAHSEQDNMFGRIPPEVASLILAHLDDRSFWMARRTHRVFRLEHTVSDAERRVAYWWLRTSPEQAIARGRTDVLLFLQKRKRIPPNFSPWGAVVRAGHVHALETALALFPADFGQRCIDDAVTAGHTDLVLRMHFLTGTLIDDSLSKALCAERVNIALALCRAATVKKWAEWSLISAKHGHIACVQLFLDRCRGAQPSPMDLAMAAVCGTGDAVRTLDFVRNRFPGAIQWHQVFDAAVERERYNTCAVARKHAPSPLNLQRRLERAATRGCDVYVQNLLRFDSTLRIQRALDLAVRKINGSNRPIRVGHFAALYRIIEADHARTLDPRQAFEMFSVLHMRDAAAYLVEQYPHYRKQ